MGSPNHRKVILKTDLDKARQVVKRERFKTHVLTVERDRVGDHASEG
jgi:hypothetical protein